MTVIVAAAFFLPLLIVFLFDSEVSLLVMLSLMVMAPVSWRLLSIGLWVHEDHIVLRNAWSTVRGPIEGASLIDGPVAHMSDFDMLQVSKRYRENLEVVESPAVSRRQRLVLGGQPFDIDAMIGRSAMSQRKAEAKLRDAVPTWDEAGFRYLPSRRVIGPSSVIAVGAAVFMLYWIGQLIADPTAGIEIPVVLGFVGPLYARFLCMGIWVGEDQVILRNAWQTIKAPVMKTKVVGGKVDDTSDFDRFTGGMSQHYRDVLGDTSAYDKYLRFRLKMEGKEHELDVMMGRMPKSQLAMASDVEEALALARNRLSADASA